MDFSFYDNILDAIFVLDRDKKIIYSNEASSILVGISQKRMQKGRHLKDVITFDNEFSYLTDESTLTAEGVANSLNSYKEISFKTQNSIGLVERKGLILVQRCDVSCSSNICNLSVIIREMTLEENLHSKYKAELEKKEMVIEQLQQAQVELKNYSTNLEKMVEQRTAELKSINSFLNAMINSLEQGLLVFDKDGNCLPIYTKACERIFNLSPAGKKFWDVINIGKERISEIEFWSKGLFKSMIPFIDFVKLGPTNFYNSVGRYIELDYFPMKDEFGKLSGIVTVATDKTEELNAKNSANREHKFAQMIIKVTKNREQFFQFIFDCKKMVEWLTDLFDKANVGTWDLGHVFRQVHSIKGMAAMYSVAKLEATGHKLENHLSQIRESAESTLLANLTKLRVELENFHQALLSTIEECKAFLGDSIETGEVSVEVRKRDIVDYSAKLLMPNIGQDLLKKSFDEIFLYSAIDKYFTQYSTMACELAEAQDKKLKAIKFNNGDIRIYADPFREIFGVMVHLFRNAVYHGIETPEIRSAQGKEEEGAIVENFLLETVQNGDEKLRVIVSDDGQGIDTKKVREKLKQGMSPSVVDKMGDDEVNYHIFDMGISTAEQVNVIAGRGVGMSAVLSEVKKLGGEIRVSSRQNLGTTFDI